MFPEYAELISRLEKSDPRFAALVDKHKELDRQLKAVESGLIQATQEEIETLKKKKLGYKDRIYSQLLRNR